MIDAAGAGEVTVARAVLDAMGVETARRITALTAALEAIPEAERRPLA